MSMKYKVGAKVRVKSLDWYNENKDLYGLIELNRVFSEELSKFCGKALTIKRVNDSGSYSVEENSFYWTDDMFEGLVEKESQHKEYELIKAAQRVEIAAKILEEAKEELRKLI